MRIAIAILMVLHGLIHSLGFFKAFNLMEVHQLTQNFSRFNGILWLLTTLLFLVAVLLFFLKYNQWWLIIMPALLLSQFLIINHWHDARLGTIANILILIVTIFGFSAWKFNRKYEKDVKSRLDHSHIEVNEILTNGDLEPLPGPVQQYLQYAGVVGKPKVRNFKVEFTGRIRKNEQSQWMPFESEQYNFLDTTTRLFFMKATMKQLPVAGYHFYNNGDAFMDIRLLSLVRVQYQSGEQMGKAETVTFFNDMCFMAPATLIDKRINWLESNGNKVKAQFSTGGITITAWLHFNEEGQLVNFTSEDRYAQMEDGSMKQLPWSTPSNKYSEIGGLRLSTDADAVYRYPEGNMVYGNFKMKNVETNVIIK